MKLGRGRWLTGDYDKVRGWGVIGHPRHKLAFDKRSVLDKQATSLLKGKRCNDCYLSPQPCAECLSKRPHPQPQSDVVTALCRVCGHGFQCIRRQGPRPGICPACLAPKSGRTVTAVCLTCATEFSYVKKRGRARQFCSEACYPNVLNRQRELAVCGCGAAKSPTAVSCRACYWAPRRRRYLTKPCAYCGFEFTRRIERDQPKFCGDACARAAQQARKIAIRTKTCSGCGIVFNCGHLGGKRRKQKKLYCTRACWRLHGVMPPGRKSPPRAKPPKPARVCVVCGAERPKFRLKYCSDACVQAAHTHDPKPCHPLVDVCLYCDSPLAATRNGRMFCSKRCSKRMRKYTRFWSGLNPDAKREMALAASALKKLNRRLNSSRVGLDAEYPMEHTDA